ncbi:DUF4149 domain-containing protein [Pseudomonas otitidis]|uniref:DUF4149 domain-containing protein n=1 Tax=Metapseudomonas otitidis TaxID=319939 RepID=A0A7X3H8H8_9GAMM|nr:DUF4149 domain-containing protein [Pseudomonas otitidis]
MSDRRSSRAAVAGWQLAQTFWVGGLWLLHFVVLPALERVGFAPLLVEELSRSLSPLLVGFAAFCGVLQLGLLAWLEGARSVLRDSRGQLLLVILLAAMIFLVVSFWKAEFARLLAFSYMVLTLCGALLVVQPVPGSDRRRAR